MDTLKKVLVFQLVEAVVVIVARQLFDFPFVQLLKIKSQTKRVPHAGATSRSTWVMTFAQMNTRIACGLLEHGRRCPPNVQACFGWNAQFRGSRSSTKLNTKHATRQRKVDSRKSTSASMAVRISLPSSRWSLMKTVPTLSDIPNRVTIARAKLVAWWCTWNNRPKDETHT